MCGFVGLVGKGVDPIQFNRALDVIAHRGPDASGTFAEGDAPRKIMLGHRRLAIIDLSPAGAQPMHAANGRHVIVFNGEIFNYRELRAELEREGVIFRSNSDTEVLLEAYVRRGPALFATLNGMFALAIGDRETGEVVFARDHLGVKPLYYSDLGDNLVFGSEIKSLLSLGVAPRLNRALVGEYLAQMWIQEPDTLFEGVKKLPAGCWARLHNGELEVRQFWDPIAPVPVDAAEALSRIETLLGDAIERQLIADRPVGSYLSGGVDSSLITHLAAERIPDLITVSARFAESDLRYEGIPDDGRWVDHFRRLRPGSAHHEVTLSADLYDTYREMIWYMDEPIADAAAVPAYLLAKRAREAGAIVMLSGMGADEIFAGYSRYAAVQVLAGLEGVPSAVRGMALTAAVQFQRFAGGPLKRTASHAERFLRASADSWPLSYVPMIGHFSPDEVDTLAGSAWRKLYVEKQMAVLSGTEGTSRLFQAQRLDLKGFLASHNLIYADKASMAASVEVRVPLLDYRLAELALGLPDALRATRRQEKVLLKALCAKLVDPAIAYRKKAGFAMPIRSWLRDALRPEVEAALTVGPITTLLEPIALRRLLDEHYSGRREHTWKLWTLLNLDLWLRRFSVTT